MTVVIIVQPSDSLRVFRGGGYYYAPANAMAVDCSGSAPLEVDEDFGLRVMVVK